VPVNPSSSHFEEDRDRLTTSKNADIVTAIAVFLATKFRLKMFVESFFFIGKIK